MPKIIEIKKEKINSDKFYIVWMLHDRCTYDCSYCPPSNKAGDDSWLKIGFSKEFVDRLESRLESQNKKNVHVHFTGGEPTVWPNFIELVDHIYSKGWKITISTNGSRSLNWWLENHSKFQGIGFSYHSEFAEPKEFISKVSTIAAQRHILCTLVEVMMNPFRWERCVEMVETFKNSNPVVPVKAIPLQPEFGLQQLNITSYTAEQLDYIKQNDIDRQQWWKEYCRSEQFQAIDKKDLDNVIAVLETREESALDAEYLILHGLANFKGWHCSIGLEQIFINSQGKIYGGTCLQGELIGNIQRSSSLNWPTGPTVCQSVWCGCIPDIRVSKFNPNYFLPS